MYYLYNYYFKSKLICSTSINNPRINLNHINRATFHRVVVEAEAVASKDTPVAVEEVEAAIESLYAITL